MNLYKKNPKVKKNVAVQGVLFDENTVVTGDEFEPFVKPNEISGTPAKLVQVGYGDLTAPQREYLDHYRANKKPPPPRHLGATTTVDFQMKEEGVEAHVVVPPKVHDAPKPEPEKDDPEVAKVESEVKVETKKKEKKVRQEVKKTKGKQTISTKKKAPKRLGSPHEVVNLLPGVTVNNVDKILRKFATYEALAGSSNVDLRICGVRSNMFGKLRGMASHIAKKG